MTADGTRNMSSRPPPALAEFGRLHEDDTRTRNWKRFGPYLSERQWGTVREDYSERGDCWADFSHDQARSRAYRWGEDGLLGFCDRQARLCFALALWNERDPILKERIFGLTNPEGNHGEDVKECYYYLDATPTYSYAKALYKYPQAAFPYAKLVEENGRRGYGVPEYELVDTGVFDDDRYFDVTAEYAKGSPDDILIRITIANRGPQAAALRVLPTLWFRNTWSWGREGESYGTRPRLEQIAPDAIRADHAALSPMILRIDPRVGSPEFLFTENETNTDRLYGTRSGASAKDAFHEYVVHGRRKALRTDATGTKAAAHYRLWVPARGEIVLRLRLTAEAELTGTNLDDEFDRTMAQRLAEADEFYGDRIPATATTEERGVARQAYAGLLWSKQFYHYIVEHWLAGDPTQPAPPPGRKTVRNSDWRQVYCRDVISMPDKWEYPWFAAWDLAFHMVPFAKIDPTFAKEQILLILREWYMHPNGQIPAYEYAFGDVNPPVHAWAAWRIYKIAAKRGERDLGFLKRVFHKLLLNFTWWVNRKDADGNNLFSGGFLGLDNIGIFDRSQPLPTGGTLEQADGTAWMAFYASTMLAIALEIAAQDSTYEDVASKFFEHFVGIVDAMNSFGGRGLWDEEDGFYYDQLHVDGRSESMRTRSMVGIIPLFAVEALERSVLDGLPGFKKRLDWFLANRQDLARHISYLETSADRASGRRLLAIPSRDRLTRVLRYVLDENEFLSPYGVRALSRVHKDRPYVLQAQGREYRVEYVPGDANSGLFGGNSNWRGPIWFPLNYLLVESLQRYHYFYGDDFRVECPTGSGRWLTLDDVALELARRLASIFVPSEGGRRPCHGDDARYARDPHWKNLVLFHEYFHGDTGGGVGASHQTGWTALVVRCLEELARTRR
jgi:mannosylglycerate hydrolase MGH1-like protein/glycosyl hydrolase family 63